MIKSKNIESDKFSELSYSLTKKINNGDKKKNGIYFTPPKTIQKNIEFLKPYMKNIKNVLEPSCGSCEYILYLNKKYKKLNITGIEYNKTIYDSVKNIERKNIKIYNEDYLLFNTKNFRPDLIIGNPPYYVMKINQIDKSYTDYFSGRPNIFILFIIKSLNILDDDGILSFVLPKSFLNCLYYDKTRKYIVSNFNILTIFECFDEYIDTKQETIIIIIQKSKIKKNNNNKYILKNNSYCILGTPENIIKLNNLYKKSNRLSTLNFEVKVGNIVWNQCKKILTNDKSKTLLIYSSDIKNNKLNIQNYSNKEKKNYINKKGLKEPILVINRGYGVGNYNFNYCLINGNKEYLIENHLICIKLKEKKDNKTTIKLYNKIIDSFKNNKTKEFIELYFGNNAINTTELSEILPIYNINPTYNIKKKNK